MTSENSDWNAPEVSPLTEADGASGHPSARIRNGGNGTPSPSPTQT